MRNTKRPKILLAIEEARAHGDISGEMPSIEAAKEELQFLMKKIGELDDAIKNSEIRE